MSTAMLRMRWSVWRELRTELQRTGRRVPASRRIAYAWSSLLFSLTDRLQLQTYGAELRAQPRARDSLFVLGFWRSGTTFLHELLSADATFHTPTTEECMNATTLLSGMARRSGGEVVTRPMDGVQISAESPQEDEFALLALGAPSIYRGFVAPELLRAINPLVTRPGTAEAASWSSHFLDLLARLRRHDQRRLLLKSPNHTFKVRLIDSLLPDSKYLLVRRHPHDLWRSNLKMWRSMNALYGLAPLTDDALAEFLRAAIRACIQEVRWMRAHLPPQRYVEITYEALAADPLEVLNHANEQMGAWTPGLESGAIRIQCERLKRKDPVPPPAASPGNFAELAELAELYGYRL